MHKVKHAMLHRNVMIVYGYNDHDWKAYCLVVPGDDHQAEAKEWLEVGRNGCPITEAQARGIAPYIADEFDELGLVWRK